MLSFSFHLRNTAKLWLLCYSLIIYTTSYTQDGNITAADNSNTGTNRENSKMLLTLMQQIDSISHTSGIARHFAKIYTASMGNISVQLKGMDSGAQAFITKFEISFINYFLEACNEFNSGKIESGSVWYFYFSHPAATSWQLTLIGVNAHINGDIWKGLVKNFSEQEIRKYKKQLLSFQSSISRAFQPFFDELMEQSPYLRFINGFTKGSAKRYGEWLIYNWRLRQINLAIRYFHDREKFEKKFAVVKRKKAKIDNVILRNKKIPVL